MGRCYEFGVEIASGCEHAMHVAPAGGQCQCPSCGVTCDGRFSGCAAILAMPGYVPVNRPTPLAGDPASEAPSPSAAPVPGAGLDALRAELQGQLREMREIVDAALATMTAMAVPEMRPLAASKLVGLRRRLAELGPSAPAPAPEPSQASLPTPD